MVSCLRDANGAGGAFDVGVGEEVEEGDGRAGGLTVGGVEEDDVE